MATTTSTTSAFAAATLSRHAEPLVELEAELRRAREDADAAYSARDAYLQSLRGQGRTFAEASQDEGYKRLDERVDETQDRVFSLIECIGETPTRTLAGAWVKARLLGWLNEDSLFDDNRDAACIRTLHEGLEALATQEAARFVSATAAGRGAPARGRTALLPDLAA